MVGSVFEAYSNLPGFDNSLSGSGFFDTQDLWDDDFPDDNMSAATKEALTAVEENTSDLEGQDDNKHSNLKRPSSRRKPVAERKPRSPSAVQDISTDQSESKGKQHPRQPPPSSKKERSHSISSLNKSTTTKPPSTRQLLSDESKTRKKASRRKSSTGTMASRPSLEERNRAAEELAVSEAGGRERFAERQESLIHAEAPTSIAQSAIPNQTSITSMSVTSAGNNKLRLSIRYSSARNLNTAAHIHSATPEEEAIPKPPKLTRRKTTEGQIRRRVKKTLSSERILLNNDESTESTKAQRKTKRRTSLSASDSGLHRSRCSDDEKHILSSSSSSGRASKESETRKLRTARSSRKLRSNRGEDAPVPPLQPIKEGSGRNLGEDPETAVKPKRRSRSSKRRSVSVNSTTKSTTTTTSIKGGESEAEHKVVESRSRKTSSRSRSRNARNSSRSRSRDPRRSRSRNKRSSSSSKGRSSSALGLRSTETTLPVMDTIKEASRRERDMSSHHQSTSAVPSLHDTETGMGTSERSTNSRKSKSGSRKTIKKSLSLRALDDAAGLIAEKSRSASGRSVSKRSASVRNLSLQDQAGRLDWIGDVSDPDWFADTADPVMSRSHQGGSSRRSRSDARPLTKALSLRDLDQTKDEARKSSSGRSIPQHEEFPVFDEVDFGMSKSERSGSSRKSMSGRKKLSKALSLRDMDSATDMKSVCSKSTSGRSSSKRSASARNLATEHDDLASHGRRDPATGRTSTKRSESVKNLGVTEDDTQKANRRMSGSGMSCSKRSASSRRLELSLSDGDEPDKPKASRRMSASARSYSKRSPAMTMSVSDGDEPPEPSANRRMSASGRSSSKRLAAKFDTSNRRMSASGRISSSRNSSSVRSLSINDEMGASKRSLSRRSSSVADEPVGFSSVKGTSLEDAFSLAEQRIASASSVSEGMYEPKMQEKANRSTRSDPDSETPSEASSAAQLTALRSRKQSLGIFFGKDEPKFKPAEAQPSVSGGLKRLYGSSADLSLDDTIANSTGVSLASTITNSCGVSLASTIANSTGISLASTIDSTGSGLDDDQNTIAGFSLSSELSRISSGRRHTVGNGQASKQVNHGVPSKPDRPLPTDILAPENKNAVWAHRRLRAQGVDERSKTSSTFNSTFGNDPWTTCASN